jgi:trans-aconitate methyltransferase
MPVLDVAGFERKFQANRDPWNYRFSPFERYKREVLLKACGLSKRGRGLELACANGESTQQLARRCLTFVAVDGSVTALADAKRRVSRDLKVKFARVDLTRQMPRGPFDLIIVSELAYYLPPHALGTLKTCLVRALARHGRIVVLNHLIHFDDAAQHAAVAHKNLCDFLQSKLQRVFHASYPRFGVASFERN